MPSNFIQKNKKRISTFLYNRSSVSKEAIQSNQFLAEIAANFSYKIDDFEQVLRFYYFIVTARAQELTKEIPMILKGV